MVTCPVGPRLCSAGPVRCRCLAPRMLDIDEHRYRSAWLVHDPTTNAWKRFEPWTTAFVDLDTRHWLFARPLQRPLCVPVVAIDPSDAFHKALRIWLLRIPVSVDAFHMVKLGNDMLTELRQRLTQQARRSCSSYSVWANRRLLLRAGEALSVVHRTS